MGETREVDVTLFREHSTSFFALLEKDVKVWNGARSVVVVSGKAAEDQENKTSTNLQLWLFGYEFSGTVIVFSVKDGARKVTMLTFARAKAILDPVAKEISESDAGFTLDIILRKKDKEAGWKADFESLLELIRLNSAQDEVEEDMDVDKEKDKIPVGMFVKEEPEGPFAEKFLSAIRSAEDLSLVGCETGVGMVFSEKSEKWQDWVKRGSQNLRTLFEKYILARMEDVIENDDKILTNAMFAEKIFSEDDLPPELTDFAYAPTVEAGRCFEDDEEHGDDLLEPSVLVFSASLKFKNSYSNMSRTFLINANDEMKKCYGILVLLRKETLKLLSERRATILSVVSGVRKYLDDVDGGSLSPFLHFPIGVGIGVELTEPLLALTDQSKHRHLPIKPGQIFNLMLEFKKLKTNRAGREKIYSLSIGDTVLIGRDGKATVLTNLNVDPSFVSYQLDDEDDEEPLEVSAPDVKKDREREGRERDVKGKDDQAEVIRRRQEEALRKYSNQVEATEAATTDLAHIESYESPAKFPAEMRRNRLFVDMSAEAVLVPIANIAVPFHVSTIKNVSKSEEGDYHFLRINLVTPGGTATGGAGQKALGNRNPDAVYAKEFTFRASDGRNLSHVFRQIKDLRKRWTQRENEQREKSSLIVQADLRLNRSASRVLLRDVIIRPSMTAKRTVGDLEMHVNGVRFTTKTGMKLDVIFDNVKHFIFQPAEKEVLVIIHFHLTHSILINKKQAKDVQFCREVIEASRSLDKRETMWERDGLEEEQREIEMRNLHNEEFKKFAERITSQTKSEESLKPLSYDVPFRSLGFQGAPNRTTVFLQPATDCLVNLTEFPPFVLTMDDVEIAYFERIQANLRNFDLVFVFKDLESPVANVNAIPKEYLEGIKDWLKEMQIPYFEGGMNLNWGSILGNIRKDPKGFYEEGGWAGFLEGESEGEESEQEETGSEFAPSGEEEESDSDSEEYGSESVVSESSGESDAGEDDLSEEGLDWDELEARARREDLKHGGAE